MPIAAAQGGTQPAAASGIPSALYPSAQAVQIQHLAQIAPFKHKIRLRAGQIGGFGYGDGHIGLFEYRGIVQAIAHHQHAGPRRLELRNVGEFVLR